MKTISLLAAIPLILTGWFAFAPTSFANAVTVSSFQLAQDEEHEEQEHEGHGHGHHYGHDRDANDEWYWGQRGHWHHENNGWQFRSGGVVCNNFGTDCRPGRNIPANGEGMVSPNNPALYFGCDSHGHHCTWKHRPGY
jgi:hypothetical protein